MSAPEKRRTHVIVPVLATIVVAAQHVGTHDGFQRPDVVLTVQSNATLRRGNNVNLSVRTDRDAYVTVYRVDTERRISVLHPASPDSQAAWAPHISRNVPDPNGVLRNNTFAVTDYPGVGYLFVIASPTPFDYTAVRDSSGWNVASLVQLDRMEEDADAMIADIAIATLPDTVPFAYDEQRYLVGFSLPPVVALACPTCMPIFGYPFGVPIREWCATFHPEPPAAPGPEPQSAPLPIRAAMGPPGIGLAPPPIYPSDVVVGAAAPRTAPNKVEPRSRGGVPEVRGGGQPTPSGRRARAAPPRGVTIPAIAPLSAPATRVGSPLGRRRQN